MTKIIREAPITLRKAALLLNCAPITLRRMYDSGEIVLFRVGAGKGRWMVNMSEIVRIRKQGTAEFDADRRDD